MYGLVTIPRIAPDEGLQIRVTTHWASLGVEVERSALDPAYEGVLAPLRVPPLDRLERLLSLWIIEGHADVPGSGAVRWFRCGQLL